MMKITFKEKSFYNEDVEVIDESETIIAQINKRQSEYYLLFEDVEYFFKSKGWSDYTSLMVNVNNNSVVAKLKTTSKMSLRIDINNTTYFFSEKIPFGIKFELKNIDKMLIATGSKNLLRNNGSIIYNDRYELFTILLFIFTKLNRRKLLLDKFI